MELSAKVALITGGARMGAAVASALAGRGVKIAVSFRRSRAAAEECVARVEAERGQAVAIETDLSNPEGAPRLVAETVEALGGLDILVNMASLYTKTPPEALDAQAWDRALAVDARAAYLLTLAAAPHMRRAGGGRIVNFSDWTAASDRPRYKDFVPYYASNKAVLGLTEALALELAPEILVNAIAPGPILAPPDLGEEDREAVARHTPLGRWGGADEIAKAVLFLIETDFVTGECIRVDGGRHLK